MTDGPSFYDDPDTLFGRLRSDCPKEWDVYCSHEFVRRAADGSLPEACFRHYLEQDYLFLIQFSRAYALAVYKADSLNEMRTAAAALQAMLTQELEFHIRYCAQWGLGERDMQEIEEARANIAYTRFVLDRGVAGDVLDLNVALAPCVVGYGEIFRRVVADTHTRLESNPYRDWIETYAAEAYQTVAKTAVEHLDELAYNRMGPGRFDGLAKTFRQAVSLEIDFWDMGLNLRR